MRGAVNERSEPDSSRRSSAPRTTPRGVHGVEVWGVLNVTPDSFSDGGEHFAPDQALARARRMLAEGADVIDVGGASSRPRGATYGEGAAPVDPGEELRRTLPVLEALRDLAPEAAISVDTTSGIVAAAALRVGARIVNDVSMGRDPALLEACGAHGAELVLMHTRADGRIDASTTRYEDVVEEVIAELAVAVERAIRHGVARERVWIDPGLGFAKNAAQSMRLLAATRRFVATGHRVLVGASRKSFLAASVVEAGGALPGPAERLGASLAAATLAALDGAHAVRVHDVFETRQAVQIARRAREGARDDAPRAEAGR
jgi:dihydropteroate synthase